MFEQTENRVAARQVFVNRPGGPDRPAPVVLAQHVEAGGVVDLSIDQDDGLEAAAAQFRPRPGSGEGTQLLQDVRRGIDQDPVRPIRADGNRRLGARRGFDAAVAHAATIAAGAVPLRKTAAGTGAEYMDFHASPFMMGSEKRPPADRQPRWPV